MAGRIIGNTIVAGYPEPGVTADEIVGMVNRYGLPLFAYGGPLSKKYDANIAGAAQFLLNTYPSMGPARCSESLTLESWDIPSSILVSVSAALYFVIPSPLTGNDDNTYAGVEVLMDGVSVLSATGSIGQSSLNGANDVGAHSFYEAYYVDTVPEGVERVVSGRFYADGTQIVVYAEALGVVYAVVKVKVLRVAA